MKNENPAFVTSWIVANLVTVYLFFLLNHRIAFDIVRDLNYDVYPARGEAEIILNLLKVLFFTVEVTIAQAVSITFLNSQSYRWWNWGFLSFLGVLLAFLIANPLYQLGTAIGNFIWFGPELSSFRTVFPHLTGWALIILGFRISIVSTQSLLLKNAHRWFWIRRTLFSYSLVVIYLYLTTLLVANNNPIYYPVDIFFLTFFFVGGGIAYGLAARSEARTLLTIANA